MTTARIVGIGATEFSKHSGRSEIELSVDAIARALHDAGLEPHQVQGLTTFTFDTSPESEISRNLGLGPLRFFAQSPFGGGGGCGAIMHAAMAIEAGVADVVACYRGLNERSGRRFGATARAVPARPAAQDILRGYYNQFGLITPADSFAMVARRYMHDTGATSEDFGRVAVVQRDYAVTNPAAWFYGRPLTLEQHQASRWIAEPLRLHDCCQESDGAVAVVLASARVAATLEVTPVVVKAAAQSLPTGYEMMTDYNQPTLSALRETAELGEQLWSRSGLGTDDVQLAILYDHFSPFVLLQLEALGFCGFGEAPELVACGETSPGGRLPVNTNGGQLSEAYIHGMNGLAEAVRQLRGTAANQVSGVENVVVTSGPGLPTSGLILGL
ncbi:MAG TPA: lipid-transfer protein [Nocardioidaceae bacterium]